MAQPYRYTGLRYAKMVSNNIVKVQNRYEDKNFC